MEKLSHAYIVSAASESERARQSRLLAAKMLCGSAGERPCGVCRDCMKVSAGVHPDLSVVKRLVDDKGAQKREIVVDQIREMSLNAYILPNEAHSRVFIVDEADKMNLNAQNAALKLLEEPPKNVYFILSAENPEKLLPTVRSRCAVLRFNTEAEEEDAEIAAIAEEYLECLKSGSSLELLAWCVSHENMERADVVSFFGAVKQRCADMLCGRRAAVWEDKKCIMDIIMLSDKCLERLKVNTGVKQIFGLLAVKSLPAKETRK